MQPARKKRLYALGEEGLSLIELTLGGLLIGGSLLLLPIGLTQTKKVQLASEAKESISDIENVFVDQLGWHLDTAATDASSDGCGAFNPGVTSLGSLGSLIPYLPGSIPSGLDSETDAAIARCATSEIPPNQSAAGSFHYCVKFQRGTAPLPNRHFLNAEYAFAEIRANLVDVKQSTSIYSGPFLSCQQYRLTKSAGVSLFYKIHWKFPGSREVHHLSGGKFVASKSLPLPGKLKNLTTLWGEVTASDENNYSAHEGGGVFKVPLSGQKEYVIRGQLTLDPNAWGLSSIYVGFPPSQVAAGGDNARPIAITLHGTRSNGTISIWDGWEWERPALYNVVVGASPGNVTIYVNGGLLVVYYNLIEVARVTVDPERLTGMIGLWGHAQGAGNVTFNNLEWSDSICTTRGVSCLVERLGYGILRRGLAPNEIAAWAGSVIPQGQWGLVSASRNFSSNPAEFTNGVLVQYSGNANIENIYHFLLRRPVAYYDHAWFDDPLFREGRWSDVIAAIVNSQEYRTVNQLEN